MAMITNSIRICPRCKSEIVYLLESTCKKAEKKNTLCRSCTHKNKYVSHETKIKISEAKKGLLKGENNPMYGKSLYDIWLEKYGKNEADKRYKQFCYKQKRKQPLETKEKIRIANRGENNPMYGKSLYDIWLEKYGKNEADLLLAKFKQKISKTVSGSGNPMYGKPSPQGSGNGWSGWYKGYFFRSILELSYLVYLVENNIKFLIIDKNSDFKVKYKKNKKNRTYFPDFYLEDSNKIIEIKPHTAINFLDNKIKFAAAQKTFGNNFQIITDKEIKKITQEQIEQLYNNGDLIFIERYEKKYKELIQKCNH